LGQADIFRKAMGKKIPEVMKKERRNFLAGAEKNGFSTKLAEEVFTLIEPFAGYAFNKAHAFSYALVAYQTAYLKANYPAEYMTALLMSHVGQPEKVASAVAECRRLGITVLPPDINYSQANFAIEPVDSGAPTIRFGLAAIKNVGLGAVEPIITERLRGSQFKSIEDLCHRVDLRNVNRRVMESLIKAGALDCLGDRGTLLHNVSGILSLAQRELRLKETGQATMFDLWGEKVATPLPDLELKAIEVTTREKAQWEKELLGVPFSKQPFTSTRKDPGITLPGEIDAQMDGQSVAVIGEIASVAQLFTRERKLFVKAILQDLSGSVEVMVWPRVYDSDRELWQEGNILLVKGKVRLREDEVQLNCDSAERYQPVPQESATATATESTEVLPAAERTTAAPTPVARHRLVIGISQTSDRENDIARLHAVIAALREFPGEDEVTLSLTIDGKVTNLKLTNVTSGYCPELQQRLAEMVGEQGIKVELPPG
jgi:DNA polymerase-3 subunit alpha